MVSGMTIEKLLQRGRELKAAANQDAFQNLSEREQRLVREATIAGFLARHIIGDLETVPKDSEILSRGLSVCTDMPDLYPLISGYVEPVEEADETV